MKKLSIVLIILMLTVGCSGKDEQEIPQESNTNLLKQSSNSEVIKKQEIDDISFDNVRLTSKENISTFTADITNISSKIKNISYIKITLYDNENISSVFTAYVGEEFLPNQKIPLVTNVEGDLTNTNSIKYEIIYEN